MAWSFNSARFLNWSNKNVLPSANSSAMSSLLDSLTLFGVEVFLNSKPNQKLPLTDSKFRWRKPIVPALASVGRSVGSWVHVKHATT